MTHTPLPKSKIQQRRMRRVKTPKTSVYSEKTESSESSPRKKLLKRFRPECKTLHLAREHRREERLPQSQRWPRLPSIESQLIEFVNNSRTQDECTTSNLDWWGFHVYVRYHPCFIDQGGTSHGEMLTLASVDIPPRYQGRRWFLYLVQMSLALVRNSVMVERVQNENLLKSLQKRPEFVPMSIDAQSFIVRKKAHDDWPVVAPFVHRRHPS